MNAPLPHPAAPGFRPARKWDRSGYTLAELMIGACLTAVLLTAAMGGVVAMQKSYSATESYGTGLADEIRLLDSLAQDLRRAISPPAAGSDPWVLDADGQGIKITVPDYYRFNASDAQHLFPLANDPVLDATTGKAYYSSIGSGSMTKTATVPFKTIVYRYANGVITRSDPWLPLVADGLGGYKNGPPLTVATSMDAFPTIQVDNSVGNDKGVLRYKISFESTFQPLAARGGDHTSTISLHNVTFVRSKNLSR